MTGHAVVWMCGGTVITWKAYAAMHVMQWRQTDKDSYRVSADRQTDLGTAARIHVFA